MTTEYKEINLAEYSAELDKDLEDRLKRYFPHIKYSDLRLDEDFENFKEMCGYSSESVYKHLPTGDVYIDTEVNWERRNYAIIKDDDFGITRIPIQ